MTERRHEPECAARTSAAALERSRWRERFSQHCPACSGWGGFTLAQGVTFVPCPSCFEVGECPRCGLSTYFNQMKGSCRLCGWSLEDPNRGEPAEPRCCCPPSDEVPHAD